MTPREPEQITSGGRKFYGEIRVKVLVHGPNACKVNVGKGRYEYWIPWSTIEDNGEKFPEGYEGRMYCETWFLAKNGIPWK